MSLASGQARMKLPASPTAHGEANDEVHSAALTELELIVESVEFCQSEQSKRLLRYLVEHSLNGDESLLKERAIGFALFHLEKGYDTNEHSIVRVRMNEIRKRLAKYYYENPDVALRFEIPLGCYHIEFKPRSAVAANADVVVAAKAPVARYFPVWMYSLAASLLLTAGGAIWFGFGHSPDALSLFWRPALRSSIPVVIATGNSVVYNFTPSFLHRAEGQEVDFSLFLTGVLKLDPKETVPASDIVPIKNQFVGLGTADTVARIYAWLALQHKDAEMRHGNDVSFVDLHRGPAVLIDSMNNAWSVKFVRGFRFVFSSDNSKLFIRDVQTGKSWSLPHMAEDGQTDEDYVLISRSFNSETGQFMITGAGLTQYGTHSVGEILTKPPLLAQALAGVKPGWEKRNLQLLFYVKVYGNTPGSPKLIALYQW